MRTLALEFSTEWRSVAVAEQGRVLGCAREKTPRSTGPVALVRYALREARLEPAQIEVVAVGLGPGSYHGVRVAVAMAQGWELATGVRLLGVETMTGLAWQGYDLGWRGPARVLVDAHRGEWYVADYTLDESGPRPDRSLQLISGARLVSEGLGGACGFGPGPFPPEWTGVCQVVVPDAAVLARLAAGRTDYVEGASLEPLYLREVDFVKAPPPRGAPGREREPEVG